MTLATLDQIAPPADAIRCWEWATDGQRYFNFTESPELSAASRPLKVYAAGYQDYTGAAERCVVLSVGGDECELTTAEVDGLVAALTSAKEKLTT